MPDAEGVMGGGIGAHLSLHHDAAGEHTSESMRERVSRVHHSTTQWAELKDLLRAIPLQDALAGGGAAFASSSDDSAALYARSQPVRLFDVFISHSWSTPRLDKYLAITSALSVGQVAAYAVGACVAFSALTAWGVLPPAQEPVGFYSDIPDVAVPVAPWGALGGLLGCVASPALISASRRAREYAHGQLGLRWVPRSPRVFLDKACISQTDPERKRRGIEAIGGFLLASQRMLIVLAPEYFERMWCCFEVAATMWAAQDAQRSAMLLPSPASSPLGLPRRPASLDARGAEPRGPLSLLRRRAARRASDDGAAEFERLIEEGLDRRVIFAPVRLVRLKLYQGLVALALPMSRHLTGSAAVQLPEGVFAVVVLVVLFLMVPIVFLSVPQRRAFERDRIALDAQLSGFSLAAAKCMDESDRVVVQALVGLWYGDGREAAQSRRTRPGGAVAAVGAGAGRADGAQGAPTAAAKPAADRATRLPDARAGSGAGDAGDADRELRLRGVAKFELAMRTTVRAYVNRRLGINELGAVRYGDSDVLLLMGWLGMSDLLTARARLPVSLFGGPAGKVADVAAYLVFCATVVHALIPLGTAQIARAAHILERLRANAGWRPRALACASVVLPMLLVVAPSALALLVLSIAFVAPRSVLVGRGRVETALASIALHALISAALLFFAFGRGQEALARAVMRRFCRLGRRGAAVDSAG